MASCRACGADVRPSYSDVETVGGGMVTVVEYRDERGVYHIGPTVETEVVRTRGGGA